MQCVELTPMIATHRRPTRMYTWYTNFTTSAHMFCVSYLFHVQNVAAALTAAADVYDSTWYVRNSSTTTHQCYMWYTAV